MGENANNPPPQHEQEVEDRTGKASTSARSYTSSTWEQLLLVSAVKKHGINKWDLVSAELYARSIIFSPEACRTEYDAIQGRYHDIKAERGGDEANDMPWFEELRRLRVSQLKKELEHYNASIGSLENKLKKLIAERETREQATPFLPEHETLEHKGSIERDGLISDEAPSVLAPPFKKLNVVASMNFTEKEDTGLKADCDNNRRLVGCCVDVSLKDTSVLVAEVPNEAEMEIDVAVQAHSIGEHKSRASSLDTIAIAQPGKVLATAPELQPEHLTCDVNKSERFVQPCGAESQRDKCAHIMKNTSTSLLKHEHEVSQDDDKQKEHVVPQFCDDKQIICKSPLSEELGHGVSIESADSTGAKQQHELPAVIVEEIGRPLVIAKIEAEASGCLEKVISKHSGASLKALTCGPQAASSTENSEMLEVWGESVEMEENKGVQTRKRARSLSRGRKKKFKKPNLNEPISVVKEEKDDSSPPFKTTDASVKSESATVSHECSDSMHGKAEIYFDAEAWHQVERLSGDSHVEKSEVGSFVDGNEDLSPMSSMLRREPKVPKKFLPLLESLRAICAHKSAVLFKHNHEIQDNPRYAMLIRTPVDLGVIRAQLEDGQYTGSVHFFRDLLLMVNNALVYYPKDAQEYMAAIGLRECILKEMTCMLERETLLKREGPFVRKQVYGKAQEKRRGAERLLVSDLSASMDNRCRRNLAVTKETGDAKRTTKGASSSEGVRWLKAQEGPKKLSCENAALCKKEAKESLEEVKKPALKNSIATKVASSSNGMKERKISNESQKAPESLKVPFESMTVIKKKDLKDQGTDVDSVETFKAKEKLSEFRKGSGGKGGSLSRMTAVASTKAREFPACVSRPVKDVEGCTSITGIPQEPIKRGVGRPPKHSQQRSLRVVKEIDTPVPQRKRIRR